MSIFPKGKSGVNFDRLRVNASTYKCDSQDSPIDHVEVLCHVLKQLTNFNWP